MQRALARDQLCSDPLQKMEANVLPEESQWCYLPAAPALALLTMQALTLLHVFFKEDCF